MMASHSALTCAEFLDLAAAVALGAADAEDVRRVEAHAHACPECSKHLLDFEEVAAALGTTVSQVEPSAVVKGRLFEVVSNTTQERRSLLPFGMRPPRLPAAWIAAAASFALSVAAIAWAASLQSQLLALQNDAHQRPIAEAAAFERGAVRTLQPASVNMPTRGIVYLDSTSGTGMVMCHGLPPIEQGHAYQIWFIRGTERVSGGMLWPDRFGDGYTLIQVPQDLQSFESIGLTDEPGTGSAWPTTPRVIGTPLQESTQ
jgi:hypothetical protein